MKIKGILGLLAMALLITALPAQADTAIFHSVRTGDTLWKISRQYNVSVESIIKANPTLQNENSIKVGSVIIVPGNSGTVVPVDDATTGTHTLIVHGSGQQYTPSVEQTVNTMTVGGKSITVPARPAQDANEDSTYRAKYANLASRTRQPGANPENVPNNNIVKTAFRYMGVPYVFGGSTPNGFDCSGFVQYVYARNGIKTPRMAHHQYYAGTPIKKNQLRPGDLVFFETYTVGISHVGIYIGNNQFIHASSRGSVLVSSLGTAYYVERYRGAARYY